MKKLMLVFGVLLTVGLSMFLFGRQEHSESVSLQANLCEPGEVGCHADGIRKYKTMTPLSTAGVVLAGVSAVGLVVVSLKTRGQKHGN